MTDHDKLMTAVMSPDVKTAAQAFVDELVSGTLLAVRLDPRAYGFVTLKQHDARVSELIEANNREVERRRVAEAKTERFDFDILAALRSLPLDCGAEPLVPVPAVEIRGALTPTAPIISDLTCGCGHTVKSVISCSEEGCPVMAARKSQEGKAAA